MTYNTLGYEIKREVVSKELCDYININYRMFMRNVLQKADFKEQLFSDDKVREAFCWYAPILGESLLERLRPDVEKITGKTLHPSYSYSRYYYEGAEIERHKDAEQDEIAVKLTISVDTHRGTWPTFIKDKNEEETLQYLDPGDIIVYKGTELEHWRNRYIGKGQLEFFFYYVDTEGKYSDFKFNKRNELGTR